MIERISIAATATYSIEPVSISDLSKFNYFYGANGSGKTTISRVVADPGQFTSCEIAWKNNAELETLVYNRDFVDRHFQQTEELPGIFTLGAEAKDANQKIANANREINEFSGKLVNLNLTLSGEDGTGGKKAALLSSEESITGACWLLKQLHDDKFRVAFTGCRDKREKFKEKVLQERTANTATLQTLEELETQAATIFADSPAQVPILSAFDAMELLSLERSTILKKCIVGKSDVDIAAMIEKLGNSDWVKTGRVYFESNDGICPFCQQFAPNNLAESLNEYFDESFARDTKAISDLADIYKAQSDAFLQHIDSVLAATPRFLNTVALETQLEVIRTKVILNLQRLVDKSKEPSRVIELESLQAAVDATTNVIETANNEAQKHNKIVANLGTERKQLTAKVWRYVLEKLKAALSGYDTAVSGHRQAIASIESQIGDLNTKIEAKRQEIRELERTITSTQPTIDAINKLLKSFGFSGFSLGKGASDRVYKIIRSDGTDAKETLSEGERSFVTFLYFFHLIRGSNSESGMSKDKIVVFDDPVSSLDCDILFIVSGLIKSLFEEVRSGNGHIKQVFLLTHNVYFHKEITFNNKRGSDAKLAEETFWVVRKSGHESKVVKHDSNPVKSTYELLWGEVRKPDHSSLSIQNSLRRILEHYFKILGGTDTEKVCSEFEGMDHHICKSLLSWVNDGSHSAYDDIYTTVGDATVENYLRVFRMVFEKSGHLSHFKMMLAQDYSENWPLQNAASADTVAAA